MSYLFQLVFIKCNKRMISTDTSNRFFMGPTKIMTILQTAFKNSVLLKQVAESPGLNHVVSS